MFHLNTFLQTQKWASRNFWTRLNCNCVGSQAPQCGTQTRAKVPWYQGYFASSQHWVEPTIQQSSAGDGKSFLPEMRNEPSRMHSTKASRPASQVCWRIFTVNLTQYRVVWKEGTSAEEFPSSDWPMGMCGGISLAVNWGRRVQPLWAAPHPDKCPWATHES